MAAHPGDGLRMVLLGFVSPENGAKSRSTQLPGVRPSAHYNLVKLATLGQKAQRREMSCLGTFPSSPELSIS